MAIIKNKQNKIAFIKFQDNYSYLELPVVEVKIPTTKGWLRMFVQSENRNSSRILFEWERTVKKLVSGLIVSCAG